MTLQLEPDWTAVVFSDANDAWQEDRLRKVARIAEYSVKLKQLSHDLSQVGAVHQCTSEALERFPESADWYVGLAGYADKTLRSLKGSASDFGLPAKPATMLDRLRDNPHGVSEAARRAFARWINGEIALALGHQLPDTELCALRVAMIVGARVVGQGQNDTGDAAVVLLKKAILERFGPTNWHFQELGQWYRAEGNENRLLHAPIWRFRPTNTIIDMMPGGDRPDITVHQDGKVILVGEVKGRKDLSNAWESWMPQSVDHLRTWRREHPGALRGVFMTSITSEMVAGVSVKGTVRTGLKNLFDEGALNFVFNLTMVSQADPMQFSQFAALWDHVLLRSDSPA